MSENYSKNTNSVQCRKRKDNATNKMNCAVNFKTINENRSRATNKRSKKEQQKRSVATARICRSLSMDFHSLSREDRGPVPMELNHPDTADSSSNISISTTGQNLERLGDFLNSKPRITYSNDFDQNKKNELWRQQKQLVGVLQPMHRDQRRQIGQQSDIAEECSIQSSQSCDLSEVLSAPINEASSDSIIEETPENKSNAGKAPSKPVLFLQDIVPYPDQLITAPKKVKETAPHDVIEASQDSKSISSKLIEKLKSQIQSSEMTESVIEKAGKIGNKWRTSLDIIRTSRNPSIDAETPGKIYYTKNIRNKRLLDQVSTAPKKAKTTAPRKVIEASQDLKSRSSKLIEELRSRILSSREKPVAKSPVLEMTEPIIEKVGKIGNRRLSSRGIRTSWNPSVDVETPGKISHTKNIRNKRLLDTNPSESSVETSMTEFSDKGDPEWRPNRSSQSKIQKVQKSAAKAKRTKRTLFSPKQNAMLSNDINVDQSRSTDDDFDYVKFKLPVKSVPRDNRRAINDGFNRLRAVYCTKADDAPKKNCNEKSDKIATKNCNEKSDKIATENCNENLNKKGDDVFGAENSITDQTMRKAGDANASRIAIKTNQKKEFPKIEDEDIPSPIIEHHQRGYESGFGTDDLNGSRFTLNLRLDSSSSQAEDATSRAAMAADVVETPIQCTRDDLQADNQSRRHSVSTQTHSTVERNETSYQSIASPFSTSSMIQNDDECPKFSEGERPLSPILSTQAAKPSSTTSHVDASDSRPTAVPLKNLQKKIIIWAINKVTRTEMELMENRLSRLIENILEYCIWATNKVTRTEMELMKNRLSRLIENILEYW